MILNAAYFSPVFYFPLSAAITQLNSAGCYWLYILTVTHCSFNIFSSSSRAHAWEFCTVHHTLGCARSKDILPLFFLFAERQLKTPTSFTGQHSPAGWGCVYVSLNTMPEAKSHLICNKNNTRTRHPSSESKLFWLSGLIAQMFHLKLQTGLFYSHLWGDLTISGLKILLEALKSLPLKRDDKFWFVSCWSNLPNEITAQMESM